MDALSSLFKKKKTPEQVVGLLKRDLMALMGEDEAELAKLQEDVSKRVLQIRSFLWGEPDGKGSEKSGLNLLTSSSSGGGAGGSGGSGHDAEWEAGLISLSQSMMAEEIMPLTLTHMKTVDFEVRKGMASIFNFLLRNDTAGFASTYMAAHTSLLYQMMDGYSSPDVALPCGAMIRECVKLPHLHEALLYGPDGGVSKPLQDLFEEHVHNPNFEVAADAFETLTTILTSNKGLVFKWLNPDGDEASLARYYELFGLYNRMLQSDNYVLKRQSLKLLSEFLLDRDNFGIMIKYIGDKNNLKIIMMMLRHKQPNIQFEAFHVFKVFVANPDKPADITEILGANKAKLIAFLQTFQNEKDDPQFIEEKAMLIETLSHLPDVALPVMMGMVATPTAMGASATAAAPGYGGEADGAGGHGGAGGGGAGAAAVAQSYGDSTADGGAPR